MLRKIGRRLQSSEAVQNDGTSSNLDTNSLDDFDDESSTTLRRSSKPGGSSSASSSLSLSTLSPGGKGTRHGSISQQDSALGKRVQLRRHDARIEPSEFPLSSDTLGLNLIHTCIEPLADLIFVHGLGGTSRSTWSWQRNSQNFWPAWLSNEIEICRSRIFTFGYNSIYKGQDTPLNTLDFAKELLFCMKTFSDAHGANDQPIGKYPVIFVMHSMGGLVVKKAHIIGKSDEKYAGIMSQAYAMLFLGTPHRGSAFAEILNNVLRTTPGYSAKTYVSELEKTSTSLQDINEQFRTGCGNIKLVSLYENQKTNLGLGVKKMIVDKESAVLGYPTETSSALNADHHGMVKFCDTFDPNYIQVRNVLRMFFRAIKLPVPGGRLKGKAVPVASKKKLEELLGIHDDPAEDFEITRDRIMSGSCQWIHRRSTYLDWKDSANGSSRILWLTGLPAVGKSVLSSFIIDSLQRDPTTEYCFYYFFKSEHQRKRTVGQMLRNIAFQIAISCQSFRERLLELCDSGTLPLGRQKVNNIWEIIFEGILFRQPFYETFYWVIDGLDEADHPEVLVKLLSRMQSNNNFRILIVSRLMRELLTNLANDIEIMHDEISVRDTVVDISSYTKSVVSATFQAEEAQANICAKVLEKAHGSFLWVTLALNQLKHNWHTQNDIGQVLNDLPEGMESLYIRMVHIISEQAPRPRAIAQRILTWTVCAFRPLTIAELEVALASEFGEFLSLKDTITQICASFVIVEKSRVTLIHDTARHFLFHRTAGLPLSIDYHTGHEHVASTCLKFLMDTKKSWKHSFALTKSTPSDSETQRGTRSAIFNPHPFLPYAVTLWAYHVSLAPSCSDLFSFILEFLETSCLVWINAVATLDDMRTLTRTAQYLKLYVKRRNRKTSNDSLVSLTSSRDNELKQWAKDLIRVVGRFGSILIQSPPSIYKHIIPFCPKGSIIRETYGFTNSISVEGISSDVWDDCLARVTMGNDQYASKVLCKGTYFVTLIESGTLVVWHAESCGESRRIDHGEWISVIECGRYSPWVVTAGTKTIRVWDITSGEEVFSVPKFHERRILAVSFCAMDNEILVGYDDATIQCIDLTSHTERWKILFEMPGDLEDLCPHLISFSPDNYHALICYRGKPVFAWSLNQLSREPQKCIRPEDRYYRDHDTRKVTPECVIWRPDMPVVLITYNDTTLVEWNIENDTQRDIAEIRAQEMAISPDGNLLITSDNDGTLKVWTVPEYRLAYQLRDNDVTRSLTFSPDGQRFYDIRGPLCNIWEPDALIRSDDLDREELSSTQDTMFSQTASSATVTGRAQITALVCDAEDRFYCCGKDGGAVVLHDMQTGEKIRRLYGHSTVVSIIEMAWSVSSKYVASADDCGRVMAKRLRKPAGQVNSWAVFPLLDFRPGEAILQLLFSSSEQYLLVSSSICDEVWSLKDKKEVCRSEHAPYPGGKWINHPQMADRLIHVKTGGFQIYSWSTLSEIRRAGLDHVKENFENDISKSSGLNVPNIGPLSLERLSVRDNVVSIERVIQVNSRQTICEVSQPMGSKHTYISHRRMSLLNIDSSEVERNEQELIKGLSEQADRLIGSYHGYIVYLDYHYCFCTLGLHRGSSSIKKHFFLPKDWLSPGMLKLCIINSHGTILCPKNGEVAVIRSGIKI